MYINYYYILQKYYNILLIYMIEDIVGFFNKYNNEQRGGGTNKDIKKTKLLLFKMKKSMNTLLIPLKNANTITIGIFIKTGSRQEKKAFGIAHFLEHMTFKGTKNITSEELMIKLDSIGAQYNAMTGHEFTLYYISGNPKDIDLLLNIMIDLYLNPIYPEEDIEKERNVVLEELYMNSDNNHRKLGNKIFETLYKDSNSKLETLSRPIIGFIESIKKFTRNDIMEYRKKNYNPSNCLLCISGNFNIKKTIGKIEENFNNKLHKTKFDLFENNINSSYNFDKINSLKPNMNKYIHIDKDVNQTIVNFVFNTYDNYNSNNITVDLVCDILSNGFSSRLFNLLRNKMGVSYYNNSYTKNFSDTGNFIISVGIEPKSVFNVIKEIIYELKQMKLNGITEKELEKAKKQNETSLLFQFKDPYEYLMFYGMNYLYKKPFQNIYTVLNSINSIELENINLIINKIFTKDNFIIGTIGKLSHDLTPEIITLINSL